MRKVTPEYELSSSSSDVSNIKADKGRRKKSFLHKCCYELARKKKFVQFINVAILINTFVLAQDRYGMDKDFEDSLEKMNYLLSGIFFMEMVIMIVGLGFKEYIKDNFNIFDAVVVLISIVDIGIQQIMTNTQGSQA